MSSAERRAQSADRRIRVDRPVSEMCMLALPGKKLFSLGVNAQPCTLRVKMSELPNGVARHEFCTC